MVKTLPKRKFSGKIYVELYDRCTKKEAQAHAEKLKKTGDFARVVKKGKFATKSGIAHSVYYRDKKWK